MSPAGTDPGVVLPFGPDGGIINGGEADLDVLGQVIADAFADLPPARWLIPDPVVRTAIFPGYFRLMAEYALRAGGVYTTAGRTAAALWIRVGTDGLEQPADYPDRLAAVTGAWAGRFAAFDAALEARHPVGVAHRHLAILAVRPDRQRRGTGAALLQFFHRELDRDPAWPAYLEAADEHTRRIYLHRGYVDHGPPIQLPDDGPQMYPMWRQGPAGGPC